MFQVLVIGAGFAFGLVMLFTVMGRSRAEGRLEEQAGAAKDAAERLGRAMEADARARARDAGDGLLQDDGYKRSVRRVAPDHVV